LIQKKTIQKKKNNKNYNYKMKIKKSNIENFENAKLSKNLQKSVRGGDAPQDPDPVDPNNGRGKGNA
jgi:predicted transcriptional regulator